MLVFRGNKLIVLEPPTSSSKVGSTDKATLPVGRPNVLNRERFLQRVEKILDDRLFTNDGPVVRELEAYCSQTLGVKHSIAVCNATAGLELLVQALQLKGEVITPAFTFVATAHSLLRNGVRPVFCEADTAGLIDVNDLRTRITSKTSAILAVNVFANVCDIENLSEVAKQHGLTLIFDSAHALGSKYRCKYVGGFGQAEVFSLHATKIVNGFEGGLITTNDDQLAEKLRLSRNFGFNTYDSVVQWGTNAKMSEVHAAMALTNFECLDQIVEINRRNFKRYQEHLPAWFDLIEPTPNCEWNYHYIVGRCPIEMRDKVVRHLLDNGIFARRYFHPGAHRMQPYSEWQISLPATEDLTSRVVCLPTGQSVDDETIDFICRLLHKID
jgi:dTDP-4-amino-4,6-dideoxygalactose transaminase